MTLSALIRKGGLSKAATATPATVATREANDTLTVAEVATVADAKAPESTDIAKSQRQHVELSDGAEIARRLAKSLAIAPATVSQIIADIDPQELFALPDMDPAAQRLSVEAAALRVRRDLYSRQMNASLASKPAVLTTEEWRCWKDFLSLAERHGVTQAEVIAEHQLAGEMDWPSVATLVGADLDRCMATLAGAIKRERNDQRNQKIIDLAERRKTLADCSTCRHQRRDPINPIGGLSYCNRRPEAHGALPTIRRECSDREARE